MTPIHLKRVRELREAQQLGLNELARLAGIRKATLIAIEKGRTTSVDFVTLEALANALEVDAAYLVVHERDTRGKTKPR